MSSTVRLLVMVGSVILAVVSAWWIGYMMGRESQRTRPTHRQ